MSRVETSHDGISIKKLWTQSAMNCLTDNERRSSLKTHMMLEKGVMEFFISLNVGAFKSLTVMSISRVASVEITRTSKFSDKEFAIEIGRS